MARRSNKIRESFGDRVLEAITTVILILILIVVGYPLIYVSAATGENIKKVVYMAAEMLKDLPPLTVYDADYVEPEPEVEPGDHSIELRREGKVWYVEADWLYNLVGSVNFEDRESLRYFDRVLRTSGVFDKMREGGVRDGDSVNMYDFEFDFVE